MFPQHSSSDVKWNSEKVLLSFGKKNWTMWLAHLLVVRNLLRRICNGFFLVLLLLFHGLHRKTPDFWMNETWNQRNKGSILCRIKFGWKNEEHQNSTFISAVLAFIMLSKDSTRWVSLEEWASSQSGKKPQAPLASQFTPSSTGWPLACVRSYTRTLRKFEVLEAAVIDLRFQQLISFCPNLLSHPSLGHVAQTPQPGHCE